jgi:DNA-binding response OmpR family regulator
MNSGDANGSYLFGRLEIRPAEHTALVDGKPLSLTRRELYLLTVMAGHPQRILTREQLSEQAWGRPIRHADRSVDVYVSRLRAKLADAIPEATLIQTHSGIGYRFAPDV